ncbi:hypothetical protein B0T16DRAFT_415083 [Cercophora newfieldiana]|uniref:Uncharacterized protein n=1 Tax=Cercophora newfieldiana TaxID=92897 RepID=A0AA40CL69_9PEZI|nr:hypothetical protein B0T16DRAFT_415083 [Cercophora newfieldiana]
MPIFTKPDAAASFPIDTTTPFHPTKALYIADTTELSLTITITDITPILSSPSIHNPVENPEPLLKLAKSTASTLPAILTLTRPTHLSRTWTATDPRSNTKLAELSNPLWSLGKWTIKFPSDSPHSSHDIYLHPAGFATKADEFVKDSVPYFWDVLDGRRLCKLYKATEGRRVEVGRFVGEGVRAREGVLLIEGEGNAGEGVDEVVVGVTFLGVLMRVDSFRA